MSSCPEHGRFIYFCKPCHDRWRAANPHTAEAISRFAAGKGSSAAIVQARKLDANGGAA